MKKGKMQTCLAVIMIMLGNLAGLQAGDVVGRVTLEGKDIFDNAVVYLENETLATPTPPAQHAIMDQKDLQFIPHVLVIVVGTTVDFHNSDNVLHNVFSPDYPGGAFNLGTWPRGEIRQYTFSTPGVATLLCNVHPEMEAYVVVLNTPYYAITGADGTFRISGVPAGHYTAHLWHEKQQAAAQPVDVPLEGTVTLRFFCHKSKSKR